ncbi:MAG: hypothetical protein K6B68_10770 [Eubacterium sp.]|nr:hypothetical protein [Eubacterium sp.]
MTNTVTKTNNNESKMQSFFKEDNPKTLMILNGFTAFIWTLCTVMKLHSIITYNQETSSNLYLTGGLALFYLGMTLGYACKYAKAKKQEM